MLTDLRGRRDVLWRVASQQRGYFTAAQALDAGYSYQTQRFHAQRGNWLHVDRGIYRFREYSDMPSEENDHLVRWSLWSRGRAVVSHASALAVHDLGTANPSRVHLTVPQGFRQKDAAIALHRADLDRNEIEQREGFRVTTSVRAIAETAEAGADQDVLDSAVADLLNRRAATRRQLLHAAQRLGARAELGVERALRVELP
ncbi:MAG: type IV toxin-antitoxin system AbiEi family antitoxin domain-containing protein [Pseudonocardiaceae bacterium]